jgi:hypothetical protein
MNKEIWGISGILLLLALFIVGCNPADKTVAAKQPVKIDQNILGILNELAQFGIARPGATPEQQSARAEAVRKAKDALLDTKTPFNDRVTLACWLQGMGEQLSDKTVADLAAVSYGETNPDPRIIYALGMMVWNFAQQVSTDPFRWQEESRPAVYARQAVDLFKRASDAAPDNALYALTQMSADFAVVGKLQATLVSWSWPDKVQRETAARIAPLLQRFANAKESYGMTGPPYFTPIESWKAYSSQETIGGVYDAESPSAIFPACAVLVMRDLSKQKKPEDMQKAVAAAQKLLAFMPEKYDRLSAAAVTVRELAQTVELCMMDPTKRAQAADIRQKASTLFDAIHERWVNSDAAKYSKLLVSDQRGALKVERRFVSGYKGDVQRELKSLSDFISTLEPEDLNPEPPQVPYS